MTIYIDADGCPVVDITIRIAAEAGVECVIICDTSHVFNKPGARTITVSQGSDSVDFALVNMIKRGDVVVTQDYGLAAMCLAREALAISQNGFLYTGDNIDGLLMQRHTRKRYNRFFSSNSPGAARGIKKIRQAGGRLKGQAKRTKEQDTAFISGLQAIMANRL